MLTTTTSNSYSISFNFIFDKEVSVGVQNISTCYQFVNKVLMQWTKNSFSYFLSNWGIYRQLKLKYWFLSTTRMIRGFHVNKMVKHIFVYDYYAKYY